MNALTSRDIASMTAHAAGIKAENAAHTPGNWVWGDWMTGRIGQQGEAGWVEIWAPSEEGNGYPFIACKHRDQIANARRIVACMNACEGIPTETLESTAHWGAAVHAPSHSIPAEAARVGAGLDGESLEQGDPSCI